MNPDRCNHIVGRWAELLSALGIRGLRALCGQSMIAPEGFRDPGPDAPTCPACMRRASGKAGLMRPAVIADLIIMLVTAVLWPHLHRFTLTAGLVNIAAGISVLSLLAIQRARRHAGVTHITSRLTCRGGR
jgi:hypothetical protein